MHRRGAARRLGGVDVYYDFDWRHVFRHNRSIFPRGQSLAALVSRDCPAGKAPALLLTTRDDVQPEVRHTDEHYVVIVPIRDYLENAGADAATTYYARLARAPLTMLPALSDVTFTPGELSAFLGHHLDREVLEAWVKESEDRRELLREIGGHAGAGPLSLEELATLLPQLHEISTEVLSAIAAYIDREGNVEGARAIIGMLTETEPGRKAAAEALLSRLSDRIADVRERITAYGELVARADVTERDVQVFLEETPWIVGLPYVRARPRVEVPRRELDFVLERFDGFFDFVELKRPDDVIITEPGTEGERPPSAHSFALGPSLSKALAQAHLYRSTLDRSRELAPQYGLTDTRQPRIIILIGRAADLSETAADILRHLNLSLHRVEVIPYDVLGRRTEGLLGNVERLLNAEMAAEQEGGTNRP